MLQVIKNIFSNFSIFLFYHYAYVPMGFCFVQGELISHRYFIQGNLYPRRYFINQEAKPWNYLLKDDEFYFLIISKIDYFTFYQKVQSYNFYLSIHSSAAIEQSGTIVWLLARLSQCVCTTRPRSTVNQKLDLLFSHLILSWLGW